MQKGPSVAVEIFGLPTEEQEQTAVMQWAEYQMGRWPELVWLYHIPNGGKRRRTEAARFKAMGVKPGVPDLCLPVPRGGYHGLYVEMKRREEGRVSEDQAEWIDGLRANGYCAGVAYGCHEAEGILEAYLCGRLQKEAAHEPV